MGQANGCCGSRDALADAEPVLSADVQLTRGCKRSERRLLLLQEELVVTKLRGGTTLRPQLRLALDQLWVLSDGKEAAWEEEVEGVGSREERSSLIFLWPRGSCTATFGSQALKELWVHTLLGTPDGAKKPRVTLVPSLKLLEKELSRRHAWKPFSTRSLERLVEGQAEELLAVLQQEGPSTEGIFRRAAGGTELRELREALDCGADVDLGSQPTLLLAAILKVSASALRLEELLAGPECSNAHLEPGALQDFLRSIPCKLLVTDLYEDWMAAMQKASREEKIWELRAVAEKLPAANLLLLKRLLSLLQHIGHHAATSRMGCSNLAVCVGPNLLSPAHADLLPLEAMLEVTHKVNVLVEFLVENCRELFEEEAGSLSSPADKELPAPLERFRDLSLEEKSVPAGKVDIEHRAEAFPHAPPSLLGVLTEAGGDTAVESETGEAPPALPPATPESMADSLGRPEELARFPEERRDALADAEPVLSADVQLTRGCKRSERRLLLLQEELVVTKLRTPDGAKKPRVTLVPSLKLLEKELSRRHAAGSGCSRALFGQPLAALCGEDGTLPRPIQELLAVLQQEGPSTEGIFRRAAGGTELRELREALDCGADVDLGSQPALLLAAILKDFLRSIPCKLLVTDLYEDWMAAMQKASREEKIWELRAVAEKLPAANLLLLKRLLSLLQHIGHHAATSRMGCSNLAVCVGPNLLSPAHADLLPLEAMLEVTHKVPTAAKLDALADAEPVLSADVQLTRGCKRSERRLLLLQEELVVTKLRTPDGAKKPRVTLVPSLKLLEKELSRRHAAGSGCSRALFGQPLAALCGEDGTLPRPIQELLAVLQQEGPSTEGIFRRAAGGTELRELREALDCGADVDLGSQPALLLAAILKDFLRSIPCKLLVTDLYEDWMAAMQKASREEKIWELRAVAEKLPAANLLLLKRLLSLLQHIGHHAATSRMGCSNLAVCVGPNLLSPAHADLLPLEAMLEVTHKVNVLVEFLVENCRELFEEEAGSLSSPADKELPAPLERFRDLSLEEKSVPAGKVDIEHRAEAFPHAPPSLLGVLTEAGGDTAVESETGEAPPALPPATPESMADSLGRPEELARFPEERRFAGSAQDEEMKRSRKRREAWGEESESCPEKKRRKRQDASGDGPAQRHRQVQQVGQPRCVPGSLPIFHTSPHSSASAQRAGEGQRGTVLRGVWQ
ncbi:unnamed protein product [Bubo scandiacus]